MEGAFIILLFTIVVGVILYLLDLRHRRRNPVDPEPPVVGDEDASSPQQTVSDVKEDDGKSETGESSECCGLHLVCEKDSLSPMSDKIEYYDDEELDRFIGRDGRDYTPEEVEEFRDVLMTLRDEDVPGWARSITMRHLELPPDVRDELLMLVNEQRNR